MEGSGQLKLGDLLRGNKSVVMGILNVTPDSFYDGGRYDLLDQAIDHAQKMIAEGAAILDVGAVSTRPFAAYVDENEEWDRLKVVLSAIRKSFPDILISVDTFRSSIAEKSIGMGVDIINDISGGQMDDRMFDVLSGYQAAYVLMHIQGTPKTMQQNPQYKDVVEDVILFFKDQLRKLNERGFSGNIILDPGFGFGKTVDHNYQLLHGIRKMKSLGYPVLAGLSRKSMINKVLNTKPENALNGTTALNMLALLNGANILRVHDVKAAAEAIRLFEVYRDNQPNDSV
jgi:dihydropteroate synthase